MTIGYAYITYTNVICNVKRRPCKTTTTHFGGLTYDICRKTGMPKTEQSRQNIKKIKKWLYQM